MSEKGVPRASTAIHLHPQPHPCKKTLTPITLPPESTSTDDTEIIKKKGVRGSDLFVEPEAVGEAPG